MLDTHDRFPSPQRVRYWRIMRYIRDNGRTSVKEIAKAFGVKVRVVQKAMACRDLPV